MTRGIRGATTVHENNEQEILNHTRMLVEEMANKNEIEPASISHVLISVTKDIDATFPAKALRQIEGWTYVPVMCMYEIDVPHSLDKCIRVMMVAHTNKKQSDVQHIFHHDAVKLRPDLVRKGE